jgi:hypothetical protein
MPGDNEKVAFLRADFYDTLRWMLVGAVTWKAAPTWKAFPHLIVVGMYTALERSRTLYEFFYAGNGRNDDARAEQFASVWNSADQSALYKKYMGPRKPVNKRISHLVWKRSAHSGGTLADGSDQLNKQVLPCARDLLAITKKFIALITPGLIRDAAQFALDKALEEARSTAEKYRIDNPFEG